MTESTAEAGLKLPEELRGLDVLTNTHLTRVVRGEMDAVRETFEELLCEEWDDATDDDEDAVSNVPKAARVFEELNLANIANLKLELPATGELPLSKLCAAVQGLISDLEQRLQADTEGREAELLAKLRESQQKVQAFLKEEHPEAFKEPIKLKVRSKIKGQLVARRKRERDKYERDAGVTHDYSFSLPRHTKGYVFVDSGGVEHKLGPAPATRIDLYKAGLTQGNRSGLVQRFDVEATVKILDNNRRDAPTLVLEIKNLPEAFDEDAVNPAAGVRAELRSTGRPISF